MAEYRIVNDTYCGYKVQARIWRWLGWWGIGRTYITVEKARAFAKGHAGGVVEYLGVWTPKEGD